MNKEEIIINLKKQKVLPLFYHDDIEVCTGIAGALCKAGIRFIEFTNRGSKALENFVLLKNWLLQNHPSALLGIGTILSVQQAQQFAEAGAAFIVSPGTDISTGRFCSEKNICWIPGAFTATEIIAALQYEAAIIKIFPGEMVNENYFKAMLSVFPKAIFMISGGVGIDSAGIQKWLAAGVNVLGMGSKLITKEDVEGKNYKAIEERTKKIVSEL
jgi:2-dehydro-3-deoxyphosphogluconate aldolase / (4S)-4-hydroxy-2-oxoglutarate aldolase